MVERCEECHFVYDELDAGSVPGALRSLGGRFAMRLSNERADPTLGQTIRARPGPGVWSALEYACHVRDVFLIQRERVYLTLVEQCPSFARMHREERADLARYAAQAPAEAAQELKMAADLLAWAFAGLDEAQLQRRCTYNFPEPRERTVLWLGRHSVHEGEHHLRDVDAALRSAVAGSDFRSQPAP
jgi:S-DNA-T family DNA segregation ATPase FtsK/SpoIIIE